MSAERAIDALAAEVTPRVLAEALDEAVDRARAELADRLTRAIVDRALATRDSAERPTERSTERPVERPVPEPAAAASTTPPAAAPSAGGRAEKGLYAFAIIPARPVDLAGVAGIDGRAPLRIVQHGELGLVVSEMRLDLMDDVREDDLSETGALATLARRHDEVVRSVFDHGPVLPLRFGTVVADDAGARRLLEEQAAPARRRLAHLGTHREWGVRLTRDDTADVQDDVDPAERREMTGTSYLAARRESLQRSQHAEQETAALTQRVEQALSEHAVDLAHRGGGPGSGLLADLAYLVPASEQEAFVDAVERLGAEVAHEGLLLEMTGPWPPYSFATLESGQAGGGVVGSA